MLDIFDSGVNRAFTEIIVGTLTTIIISVIVSNGLVPYYFILYFHLSSIVGMIVLIQKMRYWATFYIVGWLFGAIILAYSGLLPITDILIYVIPLVFLVYRFKIYEKS